MKKTVLIMAGGKGERFWPKSRTVLPKQFLSLSGNNKTMIQLTVERILPLVDIEDIYIATNRDYIHLVEEQLPELPKSNILYEPVGKNTAPCIGFGAMVISKKYDDAIMYVLPSDHMIKNQSLFIQALSEAGEIAETGKNIVTLGITPNYPETGYGYISFVPGEKFNNSFKVDKFTEKPDFNTAQEYLSTGHYLWNSGMFVWKISTILDNLCRFLPYIYKGLCLIKDAMGTSAFEDVLNREFNAFVPQSIDYGIMEKASDIYTLPGTFGWDDVGSWLAIERLIQTDEQGNAISGNVVSVNAKNCIVNGQNKLIALVGVNDLVVVDTDDVVMICEKSSSQDVKQIIAKLKEKNMKKYL